MVILCSFARHDSHSPAAGNHPLFLYIFEVTENLTPKPGVFFVGIPLTNWPTYRCNKVSFVHLSILAPLLACKPKTKREKNYDWRSRLLSDLLGLQFTEIEGKVY